MSATSDNKHKRQEVVEPVSSTLSVKTTAPVTSEVDELDELDELDDLLDDFADDVLSKPPGSAVDTESKIEVNEATATQKESDSGDSNADIGELIKDLKIEDPETKKQFEQLVKQFESDFKEEAEKVPQPQNFDSVMKETMERLKKSGQTIDEQLKNNPSGANPEDLLTQLLAGLGGAEGANNSDFDMSKLLVDMLEQLSSKEVLYEPIKDLNSKFPDYLEEKKGVITEVQHVTYTKQYEITTEILAIFNAPDYNDEDKAKRENVNSLLESLQELGQPPTELVGDTGDFLGLGQGGGSGAANNNLNFNDKDLPQDLQQELEEGCKQT